MRYCIAPVILLLFSFLLTAQDFLPDSVVYRLALSQTRDYDKSRSARTSGLYSGSLYVRDYYNVKGHPFFQSDSLQKGDVFYNGVFYQDINLLYDLSHDNVVVEYSGDTKLVLIPGKTAYFILQGHLFLRRSDPLPAGEGFYELLFEGRTEILVKRVKKLVGFTGSTEINSVFAEYDNYFIYKDSSYHSVSNKRELLNVLKDKKTELKDFVSKNKPDFAKNFEAALLQTARYYDQISN